MPSDKTRINLTVPKDVEQDLRRIAQRDARSVSTAALDLIRHALEVEEDGALLSVAEERERESGALVSHARAWK
jgi:hypothetical protein